MCATNFIRALDSAFLRHGRFDYVIPIGLPDAEARRAMWQRFIPEAVLPEVDVEQLVDHTEGFSPADIEFAARSASQRALEKAVYAAEPAPVLGMAGSPAAEPAPVLGMAGSPAAGGAVHRDVGDLAHDAGPVAAGADLAGGPAAGLDAGRASSADGSHPAAAPARRGPTTQDYLEAIAETKTTVSEEVAAAFLEDIEQLARV